jgi:hypothetical protein
VLYVDLDRRMVEWWGCLPRTPGGDKWLTSCCLSSFRMLEGILASLFRRRSWVLVFRIHSGGVFRCSDPMIRRRGGTWPWR